MNSGGFPVLIVMFAIVAGIVQVVKRMGNKSKTGSYSGRSYDFSDNEVSPPPQGPPSTWAPPSPGAVYKPPAARRGSSYLPPPAPGAYGAQPFSQRPAQTPPPVAQPVQPAAAPVEPPVAPASSAPAAPEPEVVAESSAPAFDLEPSAASDEAPAFDLSPDAVDGETPEFAPGTTPAAYTPPAPVGFTITPPPPIVAPPPIVMPPSVAGPSIPSPIADDSELPPPAVAADE